MIPPPAVGATFGPELGGELCAMCTHKSALAMATALPPAISAMPGALTRWAG